jgi:hypothetical protein
LRVGDRLRDQITICLPARPSWSTSSIKLLAVAPIAAVPTLANKVAAFLHVLAYFMHDTQRGYRPAGNRAACLLPHLPVFNLLDVEQRARFKVFRDKNSNTSGIPSFFGVPRNKRIKMAGNLSEKNRKVGIIRAQVHDVR